MQNKFACHQGSTLGGLGWILLGINKIHYKANVLSVFNVLVKLVGQPIVPSCLGVRDFPACEILSDKTEKVLDELV